MASFFISYSRKDIDVARKLTEAFKDQELDFWIDWEGIPPTVDWWKEIQKGIEEADVFLFLLSPDSCRSKVCKQEIEHAATNGKRLIPIVVRDIKADESPSELRQLNWILLRGEDDFNNAFSKVITALKTDYAWLQAHRQLQVKALEWERSGHKSGFLLHGEELDESEVQLATNPSQEPHPTDLQREYVLRSRQATERSRRRLMTGLISFSAIVMILLISSLILLNISRAQQLGSQAQAAFAEQNYNAAALYAFQSNKIHTNDAATRVLDNLPYESFELGKGLLGHSDGVNSVAWSPDGRLASGSWDNTVIIWDLTTDQPAQILKGHTDAVMSVAWSADGRLASSLGNGTIIIWDLITGQPAQTLKGHLGTSDSIAWSADGRLASGARDNMIIIWDLTTGQPAQTLKGHTSAIESVAWSGDGRLASGARDNMIIIWDLTTGQPAQTLKGHTHIIRSVAWSPEGRLASGSFDNSVIIWSFATGQSAQILKGHTDAVISVAWSPDGRLVSGASDNTIIIWDLTTDQPAQILKGHTDAVIRVAWSADGRLVSGSSDNTIIIWDLITGQPSQVLREATNYVIRVAWSADGRLASDSDGSNIIIWDLATGQPAQILKGHTDKVSSIAWSPDGRLASGSWDNTVIIWDLTTGRPAQTLKGHTGPINSVAWSPDGRLASGSWDSTIIIWDLITGQPSQILGGYTDRVIELAWSSDGRLVSVSEDSTIIFWNLTTGQPAQILKAPGVYLSSVAWSPNGRLALGSWDHTVKLPRTDILQSKLCSWIYRNMTAYEWLNDQGILYVYEPACPSLPVPAFDPVSNILRAIRTRNIDDLETVFITWKGRIILLVTSLVLFVVSRMILETLYKLISWSWHKKYEIFRKSQA